MVLRLSAVAAVVAMVGGSVSCMTTYDSAGYPVQSVDPALAIAGVAAAGIAGYAIANNNNNYNGYHGGGGYYCPPPQRVYYGPPRRYYR